MLGSELIDRMDRLMMYETGRDIYKEWNENVRNMVILNINYEINIMDTKILLQSIKDQTAKALMSDLC